MLNNNFSYVQVASAFFLLKGSNIFHVLLFRVFLCVFDNIDLQFFFIYIFYYEYFLNRFMRLSIYFFIPILYLIFRIKMFFIRIFVIRVFVIRISFIRIRKNLFIVSNILSHLFFFNNIFTFF